MKVPHSKGIANHTGPESCAVCREAQREALTGVRAGQPLSRESNVTRGADAVSKVEGNTDTGAIMRVPGRPCVVGDPGMHVRSLNGNREISTLTTDLEWPASGRRGAVADDERDGEA